ncbi:CGNR zinc finger domain-containing protein [Streptomyces sp. NPDC090306]|uniref:CGNR zinc finger domain-containing protein n=1 Tax=Streptomyces sp. NPDC090306 TaxID=3365961 RepID=UPI0037F2393F
MRFQFLGDHLGLDLAATVSWRETRPVDLLAEPADLREWLTLAGLRPLGAVTADSLAAAVDVREAVYGAAYACVAGRPVGSADLALLNDFAGREPMRPVVVRAGVMTWSGGVEQALATVARETCRLVGTPEHARVRRCEGAPCTRLFLDNSRAGGRRWCDKRACGSRVNAAAYRERRAARGERAEPGLS